MKKKLKDLKDQSKFKLAENSKVTYTLQKTDEKSRKAIYTSDKSGKTFTNGWGKAVYQ